ncbi:MAG: T9SS type A sorting domain-containing protein [Elusimicrobia bacterium]|nr:T9SS type A sorting domain-containing protein [Elusimicrobiota bacterium]
MKKVFLFFAILLVVPSIIFSATDYVPKGIPGGWVRRVVEAPSAHGTFYAVSYGLFKSVDGGQTWVRKPSVEPTAAVLTANGGSVFGRHCTNSVAVSPNNANLVIVTDSGWSPLWRSTDGGDTWTCISLGADGNGTNKRANMVASSLYDSNVFYASVESFLPPDGPSAATLYKSVDGGINWSATGLTLSNAETITDVIQIPSGANAGHIVVSVIDEYLGFNRDNAATPTTGKIYYSDSSETSFTQATAFTVPAYKMTWDSVNSKIWLMTSKGEIYNSASGENWGVFVSSIPGAVANGHRTVGILYSSGTIPNILAYVNSGNQPSAIVYRSTDSADGFPANSWKEITLPNALGHERITGMVEDIVVDSRHSDGSHWGVAETGTGFCYTTSTVAGITTAGEFTQQSGICTPQLNYGIKDSLTHRIYAVAGNSVYYSANNGDTWARVYPQKGATADMCQYVSFAPNSATKVYLTASLKIYYTNDNGADNFGNTPLVDFTSKGYNSSINFLTNLIISSSNPNIMFIGIANSSAVVTTDDYLWKSEDAGLTWNKFTALPKTHGIFALAIDPSDSNIIYAGCCDQASSGGGFVSHGDGLYKTTDGGANWTNIGFIGDRISLISIDPDNSNNIVVGYQLPGNGTADVKSHSAVSTDAGATWKDLYATWSDDVTNNNDTLNLNGSTSTSSANPPQIFNSQLVFVVSGLIYGGNAEGYVFMNDDLGATSLKKIALLPTAVTWIFKGSVLATSGSGLYDLTFSTASSTTNIYTGSTLKVYNYPNPFNPNKDGHTTVRLNMSNTTRKLDIKIYTLSGDIVADSTFDNITGGYSYAFTWDGRNKKGELCAPGVYFLLADADGTKAKHKIVIIR